MVLLSCIEGLVFLVKIRVDVEVYLAASFAITGGCGFWKRADVFSVLFLVEGT